MVPNPQTAVRENDKLTATEELNHPDRNYEILQ